MAEMISTEDIVNVKRDIEDTGKAVNEDAVVTPRYGNPFDSLPRAIRILMETGGWKAYSTEAELLVTSPSVNPSVAYAFDTKKLYKWNGTTWVDEGLSPLDLAKDYTDSQLNIIRPLYDQINNVSGVYVNIGASNIQAATGTMLSIFSVEAGKTYVVKSSKIASGVFAIALRATNSTATGSTLGLVTLVATSDPTVKKFTVPSQSTAKFALINIKIPSSSFDISADLLVNEGAVAEDIVEYAQIKKIAGVTLVDEIGRAEALNKKDIILFNELYNPTNNVADNYVVLPSGSIGTSAGTMLSIFSVEAGKTYAVQSNSINNSAVAVALRATNSTATGSTLGLVTLVATSDPTVKKFTVSALGETLFALINIKIPGTGLDMSQDLSIKMSTLNETDEISGINDKELADRKARKQIISLENSIITANSNLSGKSWVAIGDSITEKNFRSNLNYHDYVSQEVGGMVIYNYGVSGSGFWNRANTIAGSITQTPDFITLFWGANDLIRAPKNLGTRDSTGTDSLGGLMNIALSALISKFYNKKFAVFTLLPRDIYNNVTNAIAVDESGVSQGYTATQVADLTIAICEKYSIPVLDLYRESNLYPWITAANQYYFTAPGNTEPDGLHPNDNGQMLIAHKIREFMESL